MCKEDRPFVHLFMCSTGKYLYDVNTDAILRISDLCYEKMKQNDFTGFEILKFKEKGYLKSNRVQISEHPATGILDTYYQSELHSLTLQITQQCNLRCEYCIYSGKYENREHDDKTMSFEVAKKGVDYIFNHSQNRNRLMFGFYGGEPLLNYKLIQKVVEYVKNRNLEGKEIEYYMTTNGTLLSDAVIKFLVENDFHLTISFDGPQCVHDKMRRYVNNTGTYSDVIKVLMKLKEKYPRYYGNSVDINSVIVPNDESIRIFDFYRYEDLFKDVWAVNGTLVNDVGYKGTFTKSETFLQAYNYEYFLVLMASLSRISSKFISTFLEDRFLYVKELRNCKQRCIENTLPKKWHHGGPCIPGEKALFLSTSGDYYPCERVNETSENAIIGNVATGVDVNRVRKVINVEQYTSEECRNCWAYRYCHICVKHICVNNRNPKDSILEKCSDIKDSVEEVFKDYCTMRTLGFDFEVGRVNEWKRRELH